MKLRLPIHLKMAKNGSTKHIYSMSIHILYQALNIQQTPSLIQQKKVPICWVSKLLVVVKVVGHMYGRRMVALLNKTVILHIMPLKFLQRLINSMFMRLQQQTGLITVTCYVSIQRSSMSMCLLQQVYLMFQNHCLTTPLKLILKWSLPLMVVTVKVGLIFG